VWLPKRIQSEGNTERDRHKWHNFNDKTKIRMGLDGTRKKGTGTNFAQEVDGRGKNVVSEIRASPLFSRNMGMIHR
jgi:hypothetical protein